MSKLIDSVRKLSDAMKKKHGQMSLFAIMLPEIAGHQWDLVLAAPWLSGSLSDYDMIAGEMKRSLLPAEMAAIGRIIVLGSSPISFRGAQAPSRLGEMRDFTFNGVPIKEAYIFDSSAARIASLPTHRSRKRRASRNGQG